MSLLLVTFFFSFLFFPFFFFFVCHLISNLGLRVPNQLINWPKVRATGHTFKIPGPGNYTESRAESLEQKGQKAPAGLEPQGRN